MPAKSSPISNEATLPFGLNTPEFIKAWGEWTDYRKERRLPKLLSRSIQKQYDEMDKWGVEEAIAAIEYSIRQGFQGIYRDRSNQGLPTGRPAARASLGALQMQLKAVENDLESIFFPGGCTYRVTPSPENQARAKRLLDQRLKLKNQIEAI